MGRRQQRTGPVFIGHYAIAFATKRAVPRVSLGVFVAATSLIDLLWPIFLLLGWERVRVEPGNTAFAPLAFVHYPITHSLLGAASWAVLFALLYWAVTRYAMGAVATGLVTVSHWFLDAVAHSPDLPLYPGSAVKVGFGLWNSVAATLVVESAMFVAGIWLYAAATRARDGVGRYGFRAFAAFLAIAYAASVMSPPPPGQRAVAWSALAAWVLPFWAAWFDAHRAGRTPVAA